MSTPLTVKDLDHLPTGAVVIDSGAPGFRQERCAWTKTDDTKLQAEDGLQEDTAWASVQWAQDRLAERLVSDHGPIFLLWDGDLASAPREDGAA